MAIADDVRVQILQGNNDETILSNDYIALMVADAKSMTSLTDESSMGLRYYVCYLIAHNWNSLDAVQSREGVTYRAPDPLKFLLLYQNVIGGMISPDSDGSIGAKESTTKGNIINDGGIMEKGDYTQED